MLHCPVGIAVHVAGLPGRRDAMSIETFPALRPTRAPWNKGRIVGQKRPLLPKHVWSIRVRLEMADNMRDLALFSCCWATSRWTARCALSALIWMLRCLCRKGSTFKLCLAGSGRPGMSPRATSA